MFTLSPSMPTATSCRFLFLDPEMLCTGAARTRPFSASNGFGRAAIAYGSSIPPDMAGSFKKWTRGERSGIHVSSISKFFPPASIF
jgi:hypothetical protein